MKILWLNRFGMIPPHANFHLIRFIFNNQNPKIYFELQIFFIVLNELNQIKFNEFTLIHPN